MRLFFCCSLLALMLLPAIAANAQAQEGLRQNAKGRYIFTHTASAPGVPKAQLYERMKSFIVEDLDASDTYAGWDDAGQDSVTTIAFLELGNSPEMTNQMVDCKAHLEFINGEVFLRLSGFNYSGKQTGSNTPYSQPLHRMGTVPDAVQSWAMTALTETLRQLVIKMDAVAAGEQTNDAQKASQPRGRSRRTSAH